jgi:hypothetical protein
MWGKSQFHDEGARTRNKNSHRLRAALVQNHQDDRNATKLATFVTDDKNYCKKNTLTEQPPDCIEQREGAAVPGAIMSEELISQ